MSELKPLPCPFCGGEPELHNNSSETLYGVYCPACGAQTAHEGFTAGDDAIAAWNRRTQPDNAPLTLEALRGMDGEPVYVVHRDPKFTGWLIWSNAPLDNIHDGMEGYGLFWWAYRRKPEPEGGEW